MKRIMTLAFALIALAACGGGNGADVESTPGPDPAISEPAPVPEPEPEAAVPDLPMDFETILAEETDCAALQGYFDQADELQGYHLGRGDIDTAEGFTRMMDYADQRMREESCYDG